MTSPITPVTELVEALRTLDHVRVERLLTQAAARSDGPAALEDLVVAALDRFGEDWDAGRVALSQVYMAGRICEEVLTHLSSRVSRPPPDAPPRIAIAVLHDHHLLGKRMVVSVLHAAGYPVADYGGGVLPEVAVRRALEDRVEVLLLSTLMLPSALRVREVMDLLVPYPDRPRVAVGGAPFRFDATLWERVGADAMGRTASDAVGIVRRLMRRPP